MSTLSIGPSKLVDQFSNFYSHISSTESDINIHLVKAWNAIDGLSIIYKSDLFFKIKPDFFIAQSAGAIKYTDCTSAYDTKQSDAGALGNAEHPFIAISRRSTLARNGSTWYGPIYGLNRTNSILMLNWIVWIRTV